MSKSTAKEPRISAVVQDFLTETYLESRESERVSLRAIADRLDVTPPAISRMAQRLIRAGLMRRDGACGLLLSESGEREALKAIRKRRVFEAFLVTKMGYTWDEVYAIACKASNHLDDDLVERMFEQAGSPHSCPHGDPIPTHDGKVRARVEHPLPEAADGAQGTISRVASHDSNLLRYLGSLNLKPGAEIQILSRAPFGGPIRLRVARGSFYDEHVIGAELAERIYIA